MSGDDKDKTEQIVSAYCRHEENVGKFVAAYRQYCWSVASLNDLKLAPFHLLATEGRVHTDKNHLWHMETLAKVCSEDPHLLLTTPHLIVDVTDPASEAAGIKWWTDRTEQGGEGMVVKPLDFLHHGAGVWRSRL